MDTLPGAELNKSSHDPFLRKRIVQKGFRYLLVGGASALIELLLFSGIYYLFGQNAPISNIIAVIVATCFNFLTNRTFAFKSSNNFARSLILYVSLFCLNLIFTTLVTTMLIHYGLLPLLAKLLTMGCVVSWNFVLYNKVIFK
jgi:putative flippase GtrA